MRTSVLFIALSALILGACNKQDPALPENKPTGLRLPTRSDISLPGGITVNTLQDFHQYVKTNGIPPAFNGRQFLVVNGSLTESPGVMLPGETIDRRQAFIEKVTSAAYIYAAEVQGPPGGRFDIYWNEYLRLVIGSGSNTNIYDRYGLPTMGSNSWHDKHQEILNNTWKMYDLWIRQSQYQHGDRVAYEQYVNGFKNQYLASYMEGNFALSEALPWAMTKPVGFSIDAYYFNCYLKLTAAAAIADVLTDASNNRIGVLITMMNETTFESTYMYIGDYHITGTPPFKWESEAPGSGWNPWEVIPDFSVLRPLAGGPPIIITPPIEP